MRIYVVGGDIPTGKLDFGYAGRMQGAVEPCPDSFPKKQQAVALDTSGRASGHSADGSCKHHKHCHKGRIYGIVRGRETGCRCIGQDLETAVKEGLTPAGTDTINLENKG